MGVLAMFLHRKKTGFEDDKLRLIPHMLLAREFVAYLSRRLVERLSPQQIETPEPQSAVELFNDVITEELSAEDQLNDEVRDILDQYADYMRREGVSYQEMFRRTRIRCCNSEKSCALPAATRAIPMKLSRDKITDISHKLVVAMRKARHIRLKKDQNDIRLQIVGYHHRRLASRRQGRPCREGEGQTQKREIAEGTEELDLLAQALLRGRTEETRTSDLTR